MNERQLRALAALLTEPNQEEAAKKAGVSSRTIRNYLTDPEFSGAYRAAHEQLVTDATQQIQRGLSSAVNTLREISEDPNAGKTARVSAARALLEHGLRYTEAVNILDRLQALEDATKEMEK